MEGLVAALGETLGEHWAWILVALAAVAFVAAVLDTLAGGGGLITVPALLLAGLPPVNALATNKLQAPGGSGMATWRVLRMGLVDWKVVRVPMLAAFAGSIAGTLLVLALPDGVLDVAIPIVLALIALYVVFVPNAHIPADRERMTRRTYVATVVPAIGAYDGAVGPGTGSMFALSQVFLRARDLRHSTAIAKTLNFATNMASLIVFIIAGKVVWLVGGVMVIGALAGGYVGSHLLVRVNPLVLRVLIAVVSIAMLIRVLVD